MKKKLLSGLIDKLPVLVATIAYLYLIFMPQSASALITVGPNINVSKRAENQAEATIAINPTDPLNLIAGSNSLESFLGQDLIWYSFDGGLTWTEVFIPNPIGSTAGGDPSVVFDRQGRAYYSHLIDCGFFGCDVASAVSFDGGQTWTPAAVTNDTLNDKNFFSVGPDVNDLSSDRIYIGYQKLGVQYVQSTIDGINWSGAVQVSDANNNGINIQFAVDDAGIVYAAWQGIRPSPASGISDLFFDSSSDGGVTWGTDTIAYTSNVAPFRDPFNFSTCGTQYCVPAAPNRGIGAYLSLEADRSGGPVNGRIYMAVVDQSDLDGDPDANDPTAHDDTDVFLLYTDDGGQNWTGPLRVNDDATQNSQMLPWLDVDQITGVVAIGWYDARNDDGSGGPGDTNNTPNDDVQFFMTASLDGGLTFLPNVQVSAGTSNEQGAEPYPAGFANFDYGEYPGIAIHDAIAYAVWADNSNSTGDNPDGTLSKQDIYTAQLEVEVNTPPVALCKDVTVEADPSCQGVVTPADVDNGSFDPDSDPITLALTPPGPYSLGATPVTLTVTDDQGASDSCNATVTVIDTTPAIVTANPNVLWPPNHKMVPVSVSVSDNCVTAPACQIISVSSNEPINGIGDGNTEPDWQITGDLTVDIRAERSGDGDGRVYTLEVECTDDGGGSSKETVTVTVPHDQGS